MTSNGAYSISAVTNRPNKEANGKAIMKRFSVASSFYSRLVLSIIVTFCSGYAYSQGGVLLNCELEGGYDDNQIYINEDEGYILYNAQLRESYERERVYQTKSGEPMAIDDGMEIAVNNAAFIIAKDLTHTFLFIKDSATFVHVWVLPLAGKDGKYVAFGNEHSGKCSVNPFSQPAE